MHAPLYNFAAHFDVANDEHKRARRAFEFHLRCSV
jgi:hypothetical protein